MGSCSGSQEPSRGGAWEKAGHCLLFPGGITGGSQQRRLCVHAQLLELGCAGCSCPSIPAFLMTSVLPHMPTAEEQQQDTWERFGGRREPTTDRHLLSRSGSSLWVLSPLSQVLVDSPVQTWGLRAKHSFLCHWNGPDKVMCEVNANCRLHLGMNVRPHLTHPFSMEKPPFRLPRHRETCVLWTQKGDRFG